MESVKSKNLQNTLSSLQELFSAHDLKRKTDVVIIIAHHILTKVLHYKCDTIKNVLPREWNNDGQYTVSYKKNMLDAKLHGFKKGDNMELHFCQGTAKKVAEIEFNSQIPDEFIDVNSPRYRDVDVLWTLTTFLPGMLDFLTVKNERPITDDSSYDPQDDCTFNLPRGLLPDGSDIEVVLQDPNRHRTRYARNQ